MRTLRAALAALCPKINDSRDAGNPVRQPIGPLRDAVHQIKTANRQEHLPTLAAHPCQQAVAANRPRCLAPFGCRVIHSYCGRNDEELRHCAMRGIRGYCCAGLQQRCTHAPRVTIAAGTRRVGCSTSPDSRSNANPSSLTDQTDSPSLALAS